ncbi:hypothetical protein PHYPSEUDO_000735 [Phytophthora pseudosyringae]|uniref:Uncharacterized protein n=1 Tax=Phytophthora pseudosyringae TaxID=221518 RepID=A0A8T1V5E8_9STRA|nr:hypothetical protein PHYPSEUDO_000735 [Phytophthora pseudosyringae]
MSKRELLEAYLGNFDDYLYTGWMYNRAFRDLANPNAWKCLWTKPIYPLAEFKIERLPDVLDECHCRTKIKWNCLIEHKASGKLEFVGSVCMEYFDINYKRCIQCKNRNRCPTRRCKKCRKRCLQHGVYHDDNAVHTKSPVRNHFMRRDEGIRGRNTILRRTDPALKELYAAPEPKEYYPPQVASNSFGARRTDPAPKAYHPPRVASKSFDERRLRFGRYEGRQPKQLLNADPAETNYYLWLFKCELLTEADRIDLGRCLYRCSCPPKGKYYHSSTSFMDIKRDDSGYYAWIKRTWTDPFIKYLP